MCRLKNSLIESKNFKLIFQKKAHFALYLLIFAHICCEIAIIY